MSGHQQAGKTATGARRGVQPVPAGYHTITPYIVVDGAQKLIDFMTKAFGAKAVEKMQGPDGKLGHAEVTIGDSHLMLCDPMMDAKATPSMIYLYVEDVDATFKHALAAGAKALKEPVDQFYGDRSGSVKDFAGNTWWIATHIEDVPKDELQRRSADMMKKAQKH